MGRFTMDDAENYGGQGGAGFFSLKDDKDVASVRFLYNGPEDVVGYAVHEVEVDGRKRYVNCVRSYNEPKDKCPFCREERFQIAKMFIPLYNEDSNQVQIWDRGKKFFHKMSSICSRYPDVVSHTFEIERNGKARDMSTTYEIYETGQDDATLDDFPEVPEIIGSIVLDKSIDDMEYYLEEGEFPPEEDDDTPVRRRTSSNKNRDDEYNDTLEEDTSIRRNNSRKQESRSKSQRRTPANNRKKDVFQ